MAREIICGKLFVDESPWISVAEESSSRSKQAPGRWVEKATEAALMGEAMVVEKGSANDKEGT